MATRPGSVPLTAAALGAVLLAALVALSPSQRAQSLGLTRHGQLITAQDAGAADAVAAVAVTPGTPGQVLTVSDAGLPHWAAAAAASAASATLYASDCTAEAGSETALVSGTGASSTLTLATTNAVRTYGTSGATAPRVICVLPAGARDVETEFQVTAVSGMNTGGYRYLTFGLRSTADGANPTTTFWGASFNDSAGGVYIGSLLAGGNAPNFNTSTAHAPIATDRWFRVNLRPRWPIASVMTGAGTAGARPPTWVPSSNGYPIVTTTNTPSTADTATMSLAVVLQSFGTGGTSSITGKLTIRVGL